LVERKDEEFVSKFYYNEKAQLIKYEYKRYESTNSMNSLLYGNQEPIDNGVMTYMYNSKGLVIEMHSFYTLSKGEKNSITKKYTYVY
jgi:hypothetical protein